MPPHVVLCMGDVAALGEQGNRSNNKSTKTRPDRKSKTVIMCCFVTEM